MTANKNVRLLGKRFVIVFLISVVFVGVINESAHIIFKEKYDRAPMTVELIIPKGTAERVEAGESVPSIPDDMVFVVGDKLQVVNEDIVDHQLGPLWVPPGRSASLVMEDANKYAYGCSFQPSRYLGIDVRSSTTLWSRFQALTLASPPTAMFLFVYSLLIFPLDKKDLDAE